MKTEFPFVASAIGLLLVGLVSLAVVACSASSPGANDRLLQTCQIAQIAEAGFGPILATKCAQAKDPLTDSYCLAGVGVRTAISACFVAAGKGDAAGVQAAVADVRDAQGKAAGALEGAPIAP